ncbi:LacI family DNA-binding transcriptional regulator [Patulibacter medicamentivorans]|uniref:LacI family DNA-binding transcriptional regulator n=1 Tax=Patulibacter medicamentivorans TaxID=1097667 RepID=UPI0009D97D5A|nr:LacI family DNA-binding transcriptional regulator [Patulibacter medicamentivorans]
MTPKRPGRAVAAPKVITIRDVAEAAGVSTATVSHVFSGRRPVSASAAERVLEVAEELGYRANTVARGLATGRSYIVALHLPFEAGDIVNAPFLASILTTISTTASEAGYAFILIPPDEQLATAHVKSLIASRRIDGAMLLDPLPPGTLREALDAAGLPVVTIGRTEGRDDDVWVDGDLDAQVGDALGHLAARGYERPALLIAAGGAVFYEHLRARYEARCAERGWAPCVIVAEALTEDAAIQALIGRLDDLDSLFCGSDVLASGALRALVADRDGAGLQKAVIGIGDSYHARHARPPLTSIDTRSGDKARAATELLLGLIEGHELPERHVTVPHELVVRGSTPQRVPA